MNNNSGNFNNKKWRDFKQAREWAHTLGLMTDKDWREYRKKGLPVDIPSNPDRDYNHEPEWVDMRDFLKMLCIHQRRSTQDAPFCDEFWQAFTNFTPSKPSSIFIVASLTLSGNLIAIAASL